MLREVDVEPRDGGFELGTRAVLEGELALHRPCDRGREQHLLVGPGEFPERRETDRVVVPLHPLERVGGTNLPRIASPGLQDAKSSSFVRVVGRSAVSLKAMSSACQEPV